MLKAMAGTPKRELKEFSSWQSLEAVAPAFRAELARRENEK